MSKTVIENCDCEHQFQDKKYGKKRRVKNLKGGKGQGDAKRCTVCGR